MTTQATKKEKNAAYHKIKLFIAQTSVEQGFLPLRKKSYLNICEDMNHFYLYCEDISMFTFSTMFALISCQTS